MIRLTNVYNDVPLALDIDKATAVFQVKLVTYAPDGEESSKKEVTATRVEFGPEHYYDVREGLGDVLSRVTGHHMDILYQCREELKDFSEACDHKVGICYCSMHRLLERLDVVLGKEA